MKDWGKLLNDYKNFLRIERGLSTNTILNYELDISKLINYLKEQDIKVSPISISDSQISQFIYHISDQVNTRSQSRIISGLKSFFKYLNFEGLREDYPLELIEIPKIGRKLPDTLSSEEIDLLIAAIDLSKPEGERNRCILETLYSCGLRVSELTDLKISDLFFDEGFIKVSGKGNKQRFVPISKHTQKYILLYKNTVRTHLPIQKGFEDTLFLNRRGKKLTRAMVFTIIKDLATKIALKKSISPHTFRHSFATHLLQNGADLRSIQIMLGHESITTTEVYMHLDRKHLSKILTDFHPRNK
nr:site-specific tyrosine recombinase/integron integrase [uncultured Flavobacterium sp.]